MKCHLSPQQFEGQFPNPSQCPLPVNIWELWQVRGAWASRASQRCAGLALKCQICLVWFFLGWQVQLKVIHVLIISYVFLSSGFSCPQLKAINQRENTEELQQNSGGKGEVLGVGWWLLELSGTSQPRLSGFYFTTSILQKGQSEQRQFSPFQCKTRLCILADKDRAECMLL